MFVYLSALLRPQLLTNAVNKRSLVTEVVFATETAANVIVYVDEKGLPYSTTTEFRTTSTSYAMIATTSAALQPTTEPAPVQQPPSSFIAPAPSSTPSSLVLPTFSLAFAQGVPTSVDALKPPSTSAAPVPVTTSPPAEQPAPSTAPVASPAPTTEEPAPPVTSASAPQPSPAAPDDQVHKEDSGDSLGLGITYDPYTGSGENAQCKSAQQIASDFDRLKDYKAVRIYASDCGIIPIAVQGVVKNGQKLMAGVYLTNEQGSEQPSDIITILKSAIEKYASGNWDVVRLFSVENEMVEAHRLTVSAVVDAINKARSQLRGLGYNGPVGAVETVPATVDNPALCNASDVVMVNCHAFFDKNTQAKDAGTFVKGQVAQLKSACNNKRVVVTESGWPHQGNANGAAVPSPDNQRAALDSLRANFDHDMFLFSAFDSGWKSDTAATFNAERYWGMNQ